MKITGIYEIINNIDGKVYIGQTINYRQRRKHHLTDLRNGKHFNEHLQRAFNKYGEENFSMHLIERCEENELDREEIRIIKAKQATNPKYGYNLMNGGQTYRRFTDKVKEKMSNTRKGMKFSKIHRQRIGDSHRGKKISRESVEKGKRTKFNKKSQWGERNPNAKISNDTAKQIVIDLLHGYSVKEVANRHNATIHTVYNIKMNRSYVEVLPELRDSLKAITTREADKRLDTAILLIRKGMSINKASKIAKVSRNTIRKFLNNSC